MSQYIDETEKLKYYRTRIANELSKQGILPDSEAITKRLDSIDTRLSILQHIDSVEGELFDTEKFNREFMAVYVDLLILYKIVYELTVNRYQATKTYIETHLTALEEMAKRYDRKSALETSTTPLGNTIFFQSNGFDAKIEKCEVTINLGTVSFTKGARATFHFDSSNGILKNILFHVGSMQCSPYDYNHDYLTIPGETTYQKYTYEPAEGIIPDSIQVMNINGFSPKKENWYTIYGGKNMIQITGSGTTAVFVEKENGKTITVEKKSGRVTFYVIGGSYIAFNFSEKPISQNFSGTKIDNMNNHQKISFEFDGSISFDYTTDGEIYATKKNGTISDGKLYYPDADNLSDFLIEEYCASDKISFNVTANIYDYKSVYPPNIKMIAIKELLPTEED